MRVNKIMTHKLYDRVKMLINKGLLLKLGMNDIVVTSKKGANICVKRGFLIKIRVKIRVNNYVILSFRKM